MAGRTDPALGSIAGPAALLGMALLAMATHLNQHRPSAGTARAILAGSGAQQPSLGDWLPWPAVTVAAAVALLCLSALIGLHQKDLVGAGALGRARRARGRDLRSLRGGWYPMQVLRWRRSGDPVRAQVRLGDHRRRPLWLPCDEHLLVLGPTGSGKSSALAIPALLEWPGPLVVTDPKGELVRTTLSYRAGIGPAAVFAPLMEPSARWNPVASIRSSEDALRVATFLMGRAPEREPFWHDLARQLLHGLLAEAAEAHLSVAGILEMLQVVPAEELPEVVRHPVARRLVQGSLSGGDRTAMGVVATLIAQLGAYGSDQVAAATGASDFDPGGIASGELLTLYCVVAPHDAAVLRGLISALISCCWRSLFAHPPVVPALFVLDEFTQLTNLPELPALVQLGRSQGVRLILMAQDLASISAAYGAEAGGALWSNCRTKLLLPGITELELLDRVSRLAGTSTLHRRADGWAREPVASQPLLHPDDVRRLKPRQALLLRGADQPALIGQHPWFADKRLSRRAATGPAAQSPSPASGRPLRDWIDPDHDWSAEASPLRWKQADVEP
ncbi:MAG: type IV secretory system conjugative DNA transfer family protein [Candidatus Dormiibacterota bacterium]|jgi:type IV secretory pathway TraG/TraD family ATPase VirD4